MVFRVRSPSAIIKITPFVCYCLRSFDCLGNELRQGGKIKVTDELYRKSDIKKLRKVRELTPESFKAYTEFDKQVMADGTLSGKVKQLIAIAVAHTTQCPFCINFHTKEAKKVGATEQEIIEAIWVAAALRAGAAVAHSVLALNSYEE